MENSTSGGSSDTELNSSPSFPAAIHRCRAWQPPQRPSGRRLVPCEIHRNDVGSVGYLSPADPHPSRSYCVLILFFDPSCRPRHSPQVARIPLPPKQSPKGAGGRLEARIQIGSLLVEVEMSAEPTSALHRPCIGWRVSVSSPAMHRSSSARRTGLACTIQSMRAKVRSRSSGLTCSFASEFHSGWPAILGNLWPTTGALSGGKPPFCPREGGTDEFVESSVGPLRSRGSRLRGEPPGATVN